ncbi:hypothetical protein [Treponema sp.]|uniref:hypothetical protein n=1 Tax=Treponema sp. TaxID=166 RepID=UPI003FA2AA3D
MKNSILIGTTDIRVRSKGTRRKQKLTAGTVKMYVLYIFTYVFAAQTRCCAETPPSVASSKIDFLVNF